MSGSPRCLFTGYTVAVGRGFQATGRGSATGRGRSAGELDRTAVPLCVRYLRIALRDKTLPHCGGKRPHCGKNRPQCAVKIDRTAVRDDRTAVGKSTALRSESTALRSESTALIDRTDRPHCGECGATSTALLCAPHCCGRQSSHRQPQGFSRARGPCLRLAQRGRALRLWLCPSETRSSLLDCGGPGATY